MKVKKNKLIIEVEKQGQKVFRIIEFMKVFRISKDSKEIAKFLLVHADILKAMYAGHLTFGSLILMHERNMSYGFFTISDHESLEEALILSNKAIIQLRASYFSSFKQIGICEFTEEEVSAVFGLLKNSNNKFAFFTGIPHPKHAKGDQGRENPFSEQANTAEQQMEEFIKGTGTDNYLFMNIIKPVPRARADRFVTEIEEYQKELEKQAEYGQSIGASMGFPIGINQGINDGYSEGYNYGTNDGYNDGYSENIGTSSNENYSLNEGYNEGDSLSVNSGISDNKGLSTGENVGLSKGFNESWGTNQNYGISQNEGVSLNYSEGESYSENYGEGYNTSKGGSISSGFSENKGISLGMSEGTSVGYSESKGTSIGASTNEGMSDGYSWGGSYNENKGFSYNEGVSYGESNGYSEGSNKGVNIGDSYSKSGNYNWNMSNGDNTGANMSVNGNLYIAGVNGGGSQGWNTGYGSSYGGGWNLGENSGYSEGDNFGINKGSNWGENQGISENVGKSLGYNEGSNSGYNIGKGMNWGTNDSVSANIGVNTGKNIGYNEGISYNSSKGYNESEGESTNWGKSLSTNVSNGAGWNQGISENFGKGQNYSAGFNDSVNIGTNNGLNWGTSINEGASHSKNIGINYGSSVSWGDGVNRGYSVNTGHSWGNSQGMNTGYNRGSNFGSSYGLQPSFNIGRNYTIRDYRKKRLVDIIQMYRKDLIRGLRGGGIFEVNTVFVTEEENCYERGLSSAITALRGDSAIGFYYTRIEKRKMEKMKIASEFSLDYEKINENRDLIRKYKYTTLIDDQNLASLIQIPRINFTGGLMLTENVPDFRVGMIKKASNSNIFMGHSIVPEEGDPDPNRPFYLDIGRGDMNHGIISGTTGSGKSVLALRYIYELSTKKVEDPEEAIRRGASPYLMSGMILDWKKDWRSFYNMLPSDRVDMFTIGDPIKPLHTNLVAVPKLVTAFEHFGMLGEAFCLAGGLGSKANQMLSGKLTELCTWEFPTVSKLVEYYVRIDEIIEKLRNGYKPSGLEKPLPITFLTEAEFLHKGLNKLIELVTVLKDAGRGGYYDFKREYDIVKGNNGTVSRKLRIDIEFIPPEKIDFDTEKIICENSRRITLEHLFFVYEIEKIFKKNDGQIQTDMAEAYERLSERLRLYVGKNLLNTTFCYNYDDMILVPELIEKDKIIILEGSGLKSNLEIKKFVTYLITGDIYNYAATKDSKGEKMSNIKVLVYEEALDIMPTKEGSANKQVLDVPIDVYERLWTQGRGYGLRGIAIVQHIGHLKEAIITSSPTSFFMKTELPQDMETIVSRLGKIHNMEIRDVEFKKFLPQMPQGWAIGLNTAAIKGLGLGEACLFKVKQIEMKQMKDDEVTEKVYKNLIYDESDHI